MNVQTTINPAPSAEVGARAVNVGAGESRSDLSKQWASRPRDQRYLSLSDLANATRQRYQRSRSDVIETRDVEIIAPDVTDRESTERLTLGLPGGGEVAPTNWAFSQLCARAKSPAGFLGELPSQIVADTLNYRLRFAREVEQIKSYATADELLAVTGPDYGRIPDYEVAEAVQRIAGNGTGDARWKVPGVLDWRTHVYDPHAPVTFDTTTLYASDRDVFIFLVDDTHPVEVGKLPDGSPDLMFRGFYIQNSEVGSASLKLAAFYLRAVCCNRIMWGVEGFEEFAIRHTKFAPDRFITQAEPALKSFADGSSARLIEGVEKAKAAKVASDDDAALEFLAGRGFSRKRSAAIFEAVEREEGRKLRTVWDAAQGITAVARTVANQDDRTAMEGEARKLLDKIAA